MKELIGSDPLFIAALELAKRVAPTTANVLLRGESGTGKELFAQLIHKKSKNQNGPFLAINCSAIPDNLLESELFGHAKGAFTGAFEKRIGIFEEAQNGTLFLDEIGDLSLPLQSKLLRVIQERTIKRIGENQGRSVNCRIISATHKNLLAETRLNRFRDDLYFRLNVVPIHIPPLRHRKQDILPLAEYFLDKICKSNSINKKQFSEETKSYILTHSWSGNIRELENSIERAVITSNCLDISLKEFLPLEEDCEVESDSFTVKINGHLPTVQEVIKKYIEFAIIKKNGARDSTAKEIGIDRKTLYKRIRQNVGVIQL